MRSSGASSPTSAISHRPRVFPRFITGDYGLGHTVLPAPDFDKTVAFVRNVLGFGLSDIYNFKPAGDAGPTVRIHFFHCANARHHSLALPNSLLPRVACT